MLSLDCEPVDLLEARSQGLINGFDRGHITFLVHCFAYHLKPFLLFGGLFFCALALIFK